MDPSGTDASESLQYPLRQADWSSQWSSRPRPQRTRSAFALSEAVSGAIQSLRSRSLPRADGKEDTTLEVNGGGELAGNPFEMMGSMSSRLRNKLAVKQQKTIILELASDQSKQYRTQTLRELFQSIQHEIYDIELFTATNAEDCGQIDSVVEKKGHKYSGGWLTQRDLRRLETVYAPQEEPVLIVRRHCILFSFDPLRGVILWDRIIVLVPDGADSLLLLLEQNLFEYSAEEQRAFVPRILTKKDAKPQTNSILGLLPLAKPLNSANQDTIGKLTDTGSRNTETRTFAELDEYTQKSKATATDSRPRDANSFANLTSLMETHSESSGSSFVTAGPFEMQALEAVLETVVEMQSNEHDRLHAEVQQQLRVLSGSASVSASNQEALRNLKNLVSAQEVRVRRCKTVLEDMLEEDEDMALMNLTKLRGDPKLYSWPLSDEILRHHSEVELLLEAYLTDYNSVLNKLEVLTNQVRNCEDSVSLRLDDVRNQFLFAGTMFALLSTWFTFGALIAGIFGQNLNHGLEYDPFYFNLITSLTASAIVLAVGLGMWLLVRMWKGKELGKIH